MKCIQCNNELINHNRKFCSYECSGLSRRRRIVKRCKTCGVEFETFACRKSLYCSRNCYGRAKIRKTENGKKKCANCNIIKKISIFGNNNSWCKLCISGASAKSQQTSRGRYKYSVNLARRRKIKFEIFEKDYIELISLNCHYCDGKLNGNGVGLDRKDNKKSYTTDNCVPCCARCNYVKNWFLTYDEMLWLGKHLKTLDDKRKNIISVE